VNEFQKEYGIGTSVHMLDGTAVSAYYYDKRQMPHPSSNEIEQLKEQLAEAEDLLAEYSCELLREAHRAGEALRRLDEENSDRTVLYLISGRRGNQVE